MQQTKRICQEDTSKKNKVSNEEIEHLIAQAKCGDRKALASLCRAISRSVLFSTMYFLRNHHDAEDVAQEVLIRVCERIGGLDDPAAFRGWLSRIIENETRRYITKNAKHAAVIDINDYLDMDFAEDNEKFLPEEYALKEAERKAVREILDMLPERQRKVIFLHYYDCLGVTEIAVVMEISPSTVSHYLKLARDKLRNEIQNQAKKTGTVYSIAFMPLGLVLTNVLRQEAEQLPPLSDSWIAQAVSKSTEMPPSPTGHVAAAAASGMKMGLITMLLTFTAAVAVVAGLWRGGVFSKPESFHIAQTVVLDAKSEVVFSGGDAYMPHKNPKQATAQGENAHGPLTPRHWWITRAGTGETIYSGAGSQVDAVLTEMRSRREDGEYALNFWMEDTDGVAYTLTRQFIIATDRE